MNTKHTTIILILITVFGFSDLHARDFYRIGQDYRSLAMGNTGVVSANNSFALFQNPAALSNVFNGWTDTPGIQMTVSDDLKEDVTKAMSDSGGFTDDIGSNLDQYVGKDYYLRLNAGAHLASNITKKGFSIAGAYMIEHTIHAQTRNTAAPYLDFFQREDTIKAAGFSYPIGLGKIVLGIGYKQIDRGELSFTYDTLDAANEASMPSVTAPGISSDGSTASGSAFDVGFIYRTATAAHISFGGVWRNKVDMGDDVEGIPTNIDLGIAMRQDSDMFRLILEFDLKDVTRALGSAEMEPSEKSITRRMHYGAELGLIPLNMTNSLLMLRSGYNSGYFTWGWEFHLPTGLYFGFARYTEEIGEYAGQRPSIRSDYYLSIDILTLFSFLMPI